MNNIQIRFFIVLLLMIAFKEVTAQKNHECPVAYFLVKPLGVNQNYDTLVTFDTLDIKKGRWIQTFDKKGNTLSQVTQTWKNDKWITQNRLSSTYDKNNNQLNLFLESSLISNHLDTVGQYYYTYDSRGNELSELSKICFNNTCMNAESKSSTYDSKGNKLTYLEKEWDSNGWKNKTSWTYKYYPNGNKLSETYKSFHNNLALRGGKKSFTYDANNNVLIELSQDWKNNTWVNSYQIKNSYDSNNNKLNEVLQYWKENVWISNQRENYSYDAMNNLLTHIKEELKYNTWDSILFIKNIYDSKKNKLSELKKYWVTNLNMTNNNIDRTTLTYDTNGNMLTQLFEIFNKNNNTWENYKEETFTYDTVENILSHTILNEHSSSGTNPTRVVFTYNTFNGTTSGKKETLRDNNWTPFQGMSNCELEYHFNKTIKQPLGSYRFEASYISLKQ